MVVKLEGLEETGWTYIECDTIHCSIQNLEDIKDRGECLNFIKDKERTKNIHVLRFRNGQGKQKLILTDKVVYLLNNEGKTIDRI